MDKHELFRMSRKQLVNAYQVCRIFATTSIASSLTPLTKFGANAELNCARDKFRILARVGTEYDGATAEETAEKRLYQSFSILEEQNLSHFPGEVLYGYYTGVTAEMIGFIFPMDANTGPTAENRFFLNDTHEFLLDSVDLIEKTRRHGSYNQVSVFTRTKTESDEIAPLRPDCIIAIDGANAATKEAAERERLNILTIHRASNTIFRVADDCLAAGHWVNWILPIDHNKYQYTGYDHYYIPNF